MRILKAKITKEDKVCIVYEQRSKTGFWDEFSLTCSEKGRPELYQAFKSLAPSVIEMCELPKDYEDRIIVKGVSFSYGGEKEVMGATITAQMKLDKSNCNLNLNTPHKASDSYSEAPADPMQLLPDTCIDALQELCKEVELYIKGERAQGKLFVA